MKTILTSIILILIIYIAFNEQKHKNYINTLENKNKPLKSLKIGCLIFNNSEDYKNYLLDTGYSEEASFIIAKTEFKEIEKSNEYENLKND